MLDKLNLSDMQILGPRWGLCACKSNWVFKQAAQPHQIKTLTTECTQVIHYAWHWKYLQSVYYFYPINPKSTKNAFAFLDYIPYVSAALNLVLVLFFKPNLHKTGLSLVIHFIYLWKSPFNQISCLSMGSWKKIYIGTYGTCKNLAKRPKWIIIVGLQGANNTF